MASVDYIKRVAQRILDAKRKGNDLVIVVSAMGNTTNELSQLAITMNPNPPARELDMLLSSGERISMALLSMALHALGEDSISLTGSQSGIVTDTAHTQAKILEIKADRIREQLKLGKIVIVAGFQGVSLKKEITTLGRGGSDVTAVALAAALHAERCEFYKDVDAIYSEDPKKSKNAYRLEHCKYEDVLSLVKQGSKVLHEDALTLAQKFSVPLYLASSFNESPGTHIRSSL